MFKRNSTQGTFFNRYRAQDGLEMNNAAVIAPRSAWNTSRFHMDDDEYTSNDIEPDRQISVTAIPEPAGNAPSEDAPGGGIDAAGADKIVAMAEAFIRLPKADLVYAKGYMDTERAQQWLDDAGNMLINAKADLADDHLEQAVAHAEAARALAGTADLLLAQTLGLGQLPAHQQNENIDLDDVESSQDADRVRMMLLNAHQNISVHSFRVGASAEAGDYLAQARSCYKTAYGAFVDGAYQAAFDAVSLVEGLVLVTGYLIEAAYQPGQQTRRRLTIQRV